ncbi:MAG: hemerythrin domain-containing protein [Bacteroidales bacterium]|nr:hemerythrin domain-containing protein [Bacteroidales bacterium]
MKVTRNFTADDPMVALVDYDYNLLPILSRFSLPLGYGNRTIGQVCAQAGVDPQVFLLIANYLISGDLDAHALPQVSPWQIAEFLKNSHDYFLVYKFPHIRQNLLAALDENHHDINPRIVEFFDAFISKVTKHFRYEERNLFPYVKALVEGKPAKPYSIAIFTKQHDEVTDSLAELKNLILRYYTTSVPNKMYDALVDIYNCEADLESHSRIEDDILVPMVAKLEKK